MDGSRARRRLDAAAFHRNQAIWAVLQKFLAGKSVTWWRSAAAPASTSCILQGTPPDHWWPHAVPELQRIHLRGAPFHAAIGRAFDEMDARDLREAQDVLHGKKQRTLDEAMDHQSVLRRIDIGPSSMMALEEQPVRRDDAVQILQRRKADGRFRARSQPGNVAADDGGLGIGGPAIRPIDHAGADRLRPRRVCGWRVLRRVGNGGPGAKGEAAGQRRA